MTLLTLGLLTLACTLLPLIIITLTLLTILRHITLLNIKDIRLATHCHIIKTLTTILLYRRFIIATLRHWDIITHTLPHGHIATILLNSHYATPHNIATHYMIHYYDINIHYYNIHMTLYIIYVYHDNNISHCRHHCISRIICNMITPLFSCWLRLPLRHAIFFIFISIGFHFFHADYYAAAIFHAFQPCHYFHYALLMILLMLLIAAAMPLYAIDTPRCCCYVMPLRKVRARCFSCRCFAAIFAITPIHAMPLLLRHAITLPMPFSPPFSPCRHYAAAIFSLLAAASLPLTLRRY